ncbi:hypothetical protein OIU92_18105 [Escherichia coli]|nr:hypothetical protein [Escherichia coli]
MRNKVGIGEWPYWDCRGCGRRGDNNHHRRISLVITNVGRKCPVVDACPDNLLRLSFNVDFTHRQGWARAMLDDQDWRDAGLRYTSQLDLLPFGQLSIEEQENPQHWQTRLSDICSGLQQLKASGRYQWILIDLPRDSSQITHQLLSLCDHSLAIVNVDANCHIRLQTAGAAGWRAYFD